MFVWSFPRSREEKVCLDDKFVCFSNRKRRTRRARKLSRNKRSTTICFRIKLRHNLDLISSGKTKSLAYAKLFGLIRILGGSRSKLTRYKSKLISWKRKRKVSRRRCRPPAVLPVLQGLLRVQKWTPLARAAIVLLRANQQRSKLVFATPSMHRFSCFTVSFLRLICVNPSWGGALWFYGGIWTQFIAIFIPPALANLILLLIIILVRSWYIRIVFIHPRRTDAHLPISETISIFSFFRTFVNLLQVFVCWKLGFAACYMYLFAIRIARMVAISILHSQIKWTQKQRGLESHLYTDNREKYRLCMCSFVVRRAHESKVLLTYSRIVCVTDYLLKKVKSTRVCKGWSNIWEPLRGESKYLSQIMYFSHRKHACFSSARIHR